MIWGKKFKFLSLKLINFFTCSILEYNDYLYSCPQLVNVHDDESSDGEDSDENDEDNWRNDYPDEDILSDDESIDERDMRYAMDNLDFENDLSSDDEDNDFIYSLDSEDRSFEGDADFPNSRRCPYERYKKRVMKEFSDDDDESD